MAVLPKPLLYKRILYFMDVTEAENNLLWGMEEHTIEIILRAAMLTKNTQKVKLDTIKSDLCKMIKEVEGFTEAYSSLLKIRKAAKDLSRQSSTIMT